MNKLYSQVLNPLGEFTAWKKNDAKKKKIIKYIAKLMAILPIRKCRNKCVSCKVLHFTATGL